MAYQITNVSNPAQTHISPSLSLVAGASVILNVTSLPTDLAASIAAGILKADYVAATISTSYDLNGFTNRNLGLGSTLQYLPLEGQNVVPSANPDQYIYAFGKKRLYSFRTILPTAPGIGNSRTISVLVNGGAVGLNNVYTDLSNGMRTATLLVQLSDQDQVQIKCDVTGTPVASQLGWTLTLANADSYL